MIRTALGALLLAFGASSCLNISWTRSTLHQPVPDGVEEAFVVDESTMGDALARLGAPIYVWELPRGHAALAWGWYGSRDLGVQVSLPTESFVDPSFQYSQVDNRLRGYVLVFDDAGGLVYVRKGYLAVLADQLRRPMFVPDEERDAARRDGR